VSYWGNSVALRARKGMEIDTHLADFGRPAGTMAVTLFDRRFRRYDFPHGAGRPTGGERDPKEPRP
jgi:hypothetical protein